MQNTLSKKMHIQIVHKNLKVRDDCASFRLPTALRSWVQPCGVVAYLEFLVLFACALQGVLYLLHHERDLLLERPLRLSTVLLMRIQQVLHKVVHNNNIPVLYVHKNIP